MHKAISRTCRKGAVCALAAALWLVETQQAKAQFFGLAIVSDPATESNTLATHVTQLLQYIQDVQMALNTLQQAQMMAREVEQLATHPSTNIAADLATISGVLAQSGGLAMNLGTMAQTFQNQFAPYSPGARVNYAAQYNQWAATALGAVRGSANSAGYQGNMIQNEQQWMTTINQMSQQPNGMDQSLQLGNSIGLETVAQLQKLRLLMINNMTSNAAFTTSQLNGQQTAQQAQSGAFTYVAMQADQKSW